MPDILLKENIPLPPRKGLRHLRSGYGCVVAATRRISLQLRAQNYLSAPHTLRSATWWKILRDLCRWQRVYNRAHHCLGSSCKSLEYTWRDPTWSGVTLIRVSFIAETGRTAVTYQQDGFAEAGVEWLIPYYQVGCGQTLAGYVAHCQALFAVQQLGLRLD